MEKYQLQIPSKGDIRKRERQGVGIYSEKGQISISIEESLVKGF